MKLLIILVLVVGLWLLTRLVSKRRLAKRKLAPKFDVHRHKKNPILSPKGEHDWQRMGTFNPTASVDKKGKVHMLFRAVGGDGVSRLGYAASDNGHDIHECLPYPIFSMENPRDLQTKKASWPQEYNPVLYPSGGSWGGAEDPRMVSIEGRIYVTFNAFDGWDFLRVAVMSIAEDDFYNKRFRWTKPHLISPKGEVHKNWVLFPEKVNGKFAILHSINPEIQIDYVSQLEEIGDGPGQKRIISKFGAKKPRDSWDTWVRSAGPAPVKTSRGWLVFYHAVNKAQPHQYRLGALLLDLKNPKKILARSPGPLLIPDQWYENDWKPGIIYACGAVVKNNELFVYYGGGDKHVCSAHTPLSPFLDWLVEHGRVS
jgi:beta-1,2-mannobiose phosphorylase / 1,2-beta-oligomannan phosphorylase